MKLYQNGCRCKVKRKENITYLYFILEKLVQIQVKQWTTWTLWTPRR